MKAHDWVNKVEEAAATERVCRKTEEQSGGAASPGEDEKEKEDGVTRGEDKTEDEPNSVQVRSQRRLNA